MFNVNKWHISVLKIGLLCLIGISMSYPAEPDKTPFLRQNRRATSSRLRPKQNGRRPQDNSETDQTSLPERQLKKKSWQQQQETLVKEPAAATLLRDDNQTPLTQRRALKTRGAFRPPIGPDPEPKDLSSVASNAIGTYQPDQHDYSQQQFEKAVQSTVDTYSPEQVNYVLYR